MALQGNVIALAVHPLHVIVLHEAAEHVVGLDPLAAQDLRHALVLGPAQLQFPLDELVVELLPIARC